VFPSIDVLARNSGGQVHRFDEVTLSQVYVAGELKKPV